MLSGDLGPDLIQINDAALHRVALYFVSIKQLSALFILPACTLYCFYLLRFVNLSARVEHAFNPERVQASRYTQVRRALFTLNQGDTLFEASPHRSRLQADH